MDNDLKALTDGDCGYIGDGAYVEFHGWGATIFTSDGLSVQNRVHIEPSGWKALKQFLDERWKDES